MAGSGSSVAVQAPVVEARRVRAERFEAGSVVHCNAQMNSRQVRRYCQLGQASQRLVKMAIHCLGLCASGRILKVGRTIADLAASPSVRSISQTPSILARWASREHPFQGVQRL